MRTWWSQMHVVAGFALILVIIAFVEGSNVFDGLVHLRPDAALTSRIAVKSLPPVTYAPFLVSTARVTDEQCHFATVELALRDPLYAPANFEALAVERGDDQAAFATAVARRSALAPESAPRVPTVGIPAHVYHLANPAGQMMTVTVPSSATKLRRGWSLRDCWQIWTQPRSSLLQKLPHPACPASSVAVAIRSVHVSRART